MKKLISSLFMVLTLTACKSYQGYLTVDQDFQANDDRRGLVSIPAGTYSGTVSNRGRDKIKLEMPSLSENDIILDIGRRNMRRLEDPSFRLEASAINQPFAMVGEKNIDVRQSNVTNGVESCTWYERVRECRRVCSDNSIARNQDPGRRPNRPGHGRPNRPNRPGHGGPNNNCRRECRMVSVPRRGWQQVEYYFVYTTTSYQIDFESAEDGVILGSFNGSDTDSNKRYSYRSSCHP